MRDFIYFIFFIYQEGASARKAQTPAMQPVPRPGWLTVHKHEHTFCTITFRYQRIKRCWTSLPLQTQYYHRTSFLSNIWMLHHLYLLVQITEGDGRGHSSIILNE